MALNDILQSLAAAWLDQQNTKIYGPDYKQKRIAAQDENASRVLKLLDMSRQMKEQGINTDAEIGAAQKEFPGLDQRTARVQRKSKELELARRKEEAATGLVEANTQKALREPPPRNPGAEFDVIDSMDSSGKPVKIYRNRDTGAERVEPQYVKPASEGRAQFTIITDPQGRIGGAWDPKHNRVVEAPPAVREAGGRRSGLPAAENARQASLKGMLQDTEDLIATASKHKDAVGGFMGWRGTVSKAQRATTGADPTTNFLITTTKNLADQLLRARSGAQINEQEYQRLSQLVPRVDSASFFDDLDRFHQEVKRTLELSTGTELAGEERPGVRSTAPSPTAGWKVLGVEKPR